MHQVNVDERLCELQVCRAAGYYEHALGVAKSAGEHELYLDILLEDCSGFDEALTYLQTLPASQAASVLQKHGKVSPPLACLDTLSAINLFT